MKTDSMNWPAGRSFTFTLTVSIALGLATAAHSATNIVTSLADSGSGSLRQAIADAAPGDTIIFNVTGTIGLGSILLLGKDISIVGPGASVLAISGNGSTRLFGVNSSVLISGMTLRDGKAPNGANATTSSLAIPGGSGGAITNAGSLTLRNCAVLNNAAGKGGNGGERLPCCPTAGAGGGDGGAICSLGTLYLSNCTFAGNTAGNGGIPGAAYNGSPPGGDGGSGGAIYSVGTLWLDASTLTNNATGSAAYGGAGTSDAGSGGAVYSEGIMTSSRTTFSGNSTGLGASGGHDEYGADGGGHGGDGGAICGLGVVSLTDCSLSGNTCGSGGPGASTFTGDGGGGGRGGCGGGIYATSNLTLVACAISLNQTGLGGGGGSGSYGSLGGGSGGSGGGVYAGGSLFLTNCTITGNCCTNGGNGGSGGSVPGPGGWGGSGGAIYCPYGVSDIAVISCTLVSNAVGLGGNSSSGTPAANGSGAGICLSSPAMLGGFLDNIVALGVWRTQDVAGAFISLGHNLIGATNGSSGFTAAGDLVGSAAAPLDPLLGPLTNNGGPTLTMALLPGSPAINAGSPVGAPPTDQRGVARPRQGAIDIGAFEYSFDVPELYVNRLDPSGFQLLGGGKPAQTCRLLGSANLSNWIPIATNQFGADGTLLFQDNWSSNSSSRFYRLVTP